MVVQVNELVKHSRIVYEYVDRFVQWLCIAYLLKTNVESSNMPKYHQNVWVPLKFPKSCWNGMFGNTYSTLADNKRLQKLWISYKLSLTGEYWAEMSAGTLSEIIDSPIIINVSHVWGKGIGGGVDVLAIISRSHNKFLVSFKRCAPEGT